jgi:hypothetical protein
MISTGRYVTKKVNGKSYRRARWVMAQVLGRNLLPTEHVHHRDGNRSNDDPANLEVINRNKHLREHKQVYPDEKTCVECGQLFIAKSRHRKRQSTCSPQCAQRVRVRGILRSRGILG